jgi:predicted regulator of Ras-like GTPase activity (Roadblock/LC7/MglB family)
MLSGMDAAQALADLTEISSQVEQVAIIDRDGKLLAATGHDGARTARFVESAQRLLDEAERLGLARGLPELSQLEVSTLDGSVFAVRRDGQLIVATTRTDPTVGLIFYDLKHCLGAIDDATEPPAVPEPEVPEPEAALATEAVPEPDPDPDPEPAPEAEPATESDLDAASIYETAQIPRVRRKKPSA